MRRASQTQKVPHIGLPQRLPVTSAIAVNAAPIGAAARAATSASGWRQTRRDHAGDRHHRVDHERHPGGRHVHEHDPVGLALLVVGRRDDQREIQAEHAEHDGEPAGPRQDRVGDPLVAQRVGETMHGDSVRARRQIAALPARGATRLRGVIACLWRRALVLTLRAS